MSELRSSDPHNKGLAPKRVDYFGQYSLGGETGPKNPPLRIV
jgi:hypothetical protein